jgi:hypothetical protein
MPRGIRSAFLSAAIVVTALLAGGANALAADKPSIEPRAEFYLKATLGRLAAAREFTYRAAVTTEVVSDAGQKIQYAADIQTAVRRPNRFWTKYDGELRKNILWYDGATLSLWNFDTNAYAQWNGDATLDDLFDKVKDKLGFTPPLSALLHEDVLQNSLKDIKVGFYTGMGVIDGVKVHHLTFSQEKVDWQIWVAAEKEPDIKRLVITFKSRPGWPQFAATFGEWDFGPHLSDAIFGFYPPEGSVKIDFQAR